MLKTIKTRIYSFLLHINHLMMKQHKTPTDEESNPLQGFKKILNSTSMDRGNIIHLYGEEESLTPKTLLCVSHAQKENLLCAIIQMDPSDSLTQTLELGVDPSTLLIAKPRSIKEAISILEAIITNTQIQVIVFHLGNISTLFSLSSNDCKPILFHRTCTFIRNQLIQKKKILLLISEEWEKRSLFRDRIRPYVSIQTSASTSKPQ